MRSHNRRLKTLGWSPFPYPAYTWSGTTAGRLPIVSRGGVELPVLRDALANIGIPLGVPPGPLAATAGAALLLMPGSAELTWLNAGADEAQLCGTDSMPTVAARPTPAAIWALLIPGAPKALAPGPKPSPTANPNVWKWPPKPPAVGPTDDMNELAGPIAEMPKVDIDAAEPVPDTRLPADESAVGNEARVAQDNAGDVDDEDAIDEVTVLSPCARLGAVAVVSWVDSIDVSWVDITELNWVDSSELNWVDIVEVIWDSMELSGVDMRELSWLPSKELTCDAV
jgi:hypothetical protein